LDTPRIRITAEARRVLEERLKSSTLADPRATILWSSDVPPGTTVEEARRIPAENGSWGVTFYDGKTLPWFQKCKIDGLPFCFVQAKYPQRLDGAVLEWTNGRFEVKESAI
jgi:hypothetical protein